MQEIKFAQMSKTTSPNPVSIIGARKEDGSYSLATVSWWIPLSYAPDMFAAAINHGSFTAERIRETGRAVLAVPAIGAEGAIIGCGTTTSREKTRPPSSASRWPSSRAPASRPPRPSRRQLWASL